MFHTKDLVGVPLREQFECFGYLKLTSHVLVRIEYQTYRTGE